MRQKRGLEDTAVSAGETMSSGCNNGADTAIAFADKAPIPGIDMFKTGVQVANTVCSGVQIAGQAVLADGAKKIDEISGVNAGKEESESSESDDS
ncbi:hypothetical protein C0J52_06586 [Blattella germanica]|nr:hypothetical protein C0J52_06586 [Blattella germanica]